MGKTPHGHGVRAVTMNNSNTKPIPANEGTNNVGWMLAIPLLAAIIWSYWPALVAMQSKWQNDPQYSQGYLVPLFSLYILYLRKAMVQNVGLNVDTRGLLLIALGLGLHIFCGYFNVDWIDGVSLLISIAGVFWLLGGLKALNWSWPAVAFLVFMLPLPHRIETGLGYPLQRIATIGSEFLLQTMGISAVAEGNVIFLSNSRIGVVEACSGLSMLLIFFALAVAIIIMFQPAWPERIVLLLSAIPVAVGTNVLRITATGAVQEIFGEEIAEKVFHDWAGWLMMPVAFALLLLVLWLYQKVFPLVSQSSTAVEHSQVLKVIKRQTGKK
jgi:exosortase